MKDLASLGLDDTCVQVYRLLAGRPAVTRAQLHARAPAALRPRLDRVLSTLMGVGLVTINQAEPPAYAPVAPDLALDSLVAVKAGALAASQQAAADLASRYQERFGRCGPGLVVESVEGVAAVRRRVEQLYLLARDEVRRLDTGVEPTLRPAAGVGHRVVLQAAPTSGPGDPGVRLVAAVPVRLVLCDQRFALVGTASDRMLLVRQSALIRALGALFEAAWQEAYPRPGEEPTAEERHILELLSTGATDETIGRRLGASTRTVRRRIHELMGRIGVTTRLQLGLEASRRGWV
ncbi:MAG TPA: helix-turn-helix transcriptional regulator [Pilimelia sp.]|nr:helix-turn-helix transcriptional regulator [Pilimelia sp.]